MSKLRDMEAEVVIIGAGITGSSLAWELAKRGKSVIVLEKNEIGREASGRNAGGVRAQNRDKKELLLAMESIKIWEALKDELQKELTVDIEYRQDGNIHLIFEEEVDYYFDMIKWERAHGLNVEFLNRDDVFKLLPNLSPGLRFIGATYCPTDGTANPLMVTKAIAKMAKRLGAKFLTRTPAASIITKGGLVAGVTTPESNIRSQTVVLAAGPWSIGILKTVGVDFPITPHKTSMFVTERVLPILRGEFIEYGVNFYMRQAVAGNIHFGVRDKPWFDLDDYSVPLYAFFEDIQILCEIFPVLKKIRILRAWTGFTAWPGDGVPVIDVIPSLGELYIAAGFSGHGFCLGPVIGQMLAEWIGGKPQPRDLISFNFNRLKNEIHPSKAI